MVNDEERDYMYLACLREDPSREDDLGILQEACPVAEQQPTQN